ncbi:MAG: HEAT repeat domain-containing protein [Spirochaetia bacterium]|jgi:HEAT repeat protein
MATDAPREDSLEVPRLGKVLLLSSNPERRAWAARTLGERGQVAAYAYLRRALWDPEEDVRATVVDAIAALAVRQSAGELAAVYAWAGPRLRRGVVRAVGRIGGGSQFDGILRLAAEDPDRRVRATALRSVRAGAMARRRP